MKKRDEHWRKDSGIDEKEWKRIHRVDTVRDLLSIGNDAAVVEELQDEARLAENDEGLDKLDIEAAEENERAIMEQITGINGDT